MDPEVNKKLLELYTEEISSVALQNPEKFLENSSPASRAVKKEKLLEKVLYEEQQVELNRKMLQVLKNEQNDLGRKILENQKTLKQHEELRAEYDELQKRRLQENSDDVSQTMIEQAKRMRSETEKLRGKC